MPSEEIQTLPVYPHLDRIADAFARDGIMMLHAETGAGKTTLVPWKLLTHPAFASSKILLLQPRRIAARAAAERIAQILGERIGQSVGLRTRIETVIGPATRLEVVTEGVLTRIIQNDQSLEKYGTVIFDEFHERNLQADMALAFTWDCRVTIRQDLKILFMSATLPSEAVRSVFGDMELVSVQGRSHRVRVVYRPPLKGEKPWDGAARLAAEAFREPELAGNGDVLVFLPGFREIRRTGEVIHKRYPSLAAGMSTLHGRLAPAEQRAVLNPPDHAGSLIILSTNVAETSITIPRVRAVIDSGLERRVRYRPRTGMDHWETLPISIASAEQRRGRAGRLGPGVCLRWWDESEQREEYSAPEIMESDLTPLLLETLLWGAGSPYELKWLTPPPRGAVDRASALLCDLGLVDAKGRITDTGRKAAATGIHPRLGSMLLAALEKGWLATAALAAALLEEGNYAGSDPDFREQLSELIENLNSPRAAASKGASARIREEALRILRAIGSSQEVINGSSDIDPHLAGKLLAIAYPDRIARKSSFEASVSRWVLVTGRAAYVSGALSTEDFLAIADLDGGAKDARIFLAAPISKEDIELIAAERKSVKQTIEWEEWSPRIMTVVSLGGIILHEKVECIGNNEYALKQSIINRINSKGLNSLPWNQTSRRLLARAHFIQSNGGQRSWPDFTAEALVQDLEQWLMPFAVFNGDAVITEKTIISGLKYRLGQHHQHILDELAPEHISLPSGSRTTVDYETGGIPVVSARIQECYGSSETPRICGIPVILHLLNPASRLVQITRDLNGFWERSYKDIRKELMGRYPRHYWPEDPRKAVATNHPKPGKK